MASWFSASAWQEPVLRLAPSLHWSTQAGRMQALCRYYASGMVSFWPRPGEDQKAAVSVVGSWQRPGACWSRPGSPWRWRAGAGPHVADVHMCGAGLTGGRSGTLTGKHHVVEKPTAEIVTVTAPGEPSTEGSMSSDDDTVCYRKCAGPLHVNAREGSSSLRSDPVCVSCTRRITVLD